MPTKKKSKVDYQRKIKTREELREIIGGRPRKKKVILCHGTFDVVHPGHLRHLMYAREKADILVASLTTDAHISKQNYRPYVPQQLRAMNLAAFEIVDYVIIDENPTPIENLKFIQPDYYAKGYEYFKEGVHPKTREELSVIEGYGGEIIFTPGDVVYSSTALIQLDPPEIVSEKLHILMQSENVSFQDLHAALDRMQGINIHVVGDTIVDSYTYCTMIGGGTKTPTFSVKYENQVDYSGGAAVVAKHLRKAGANVRFSTVLGDDALKDFVVKDLEAEGILCDPVIDRTRPTTQKNAFIASGYRLLKVDKLDNRAVSGKILDTLKKQVSGSDSQGFVFSDFRHGIFSKQTIPALVESIPAKRFKVADSQVASRWGNILEFQGFDLITPNEREARFALGDQDSVVRPLALELYTKARCKHLILKCGERGILTYRPLEDMGDPRAFFTIDSFVQKLVDPVGAGDALLAYSTLALMATGSSIIASILGSMAAAVACERDGNMPVSPEDVTQMLSLYEKKSTHLQ
jgi:rfaE bifunctional protein kinase chain/domain